MLTLQEQINNLETILNKQKDLSPENRQILNKEIVRLKQELTKQK